MQRVLYPPMIPQRLPVHLGARLAAADEVAQLRARLALGRPLAVAHADRGQPGPVRRVADARGVMEHRLAAVLLPAVAALAHLIRVVLPAGEVVLTRLPQRLLDVLAQ